VSDRAACDHVNMPGAKFCAECGASLLPARVSEERKVVSILFCDLIDFTSASDVADPEDVATSLRRYHAEARRSIETFGGVVEKFIGDAVCAAFGVPTVHEDDPERAIRAALAICRTMPDLPPILGRPLQVRCGITTGEALVRLDVDPASGVGFVTSDTVNVAARLQSVAPAGRVVVDERTFDLTRRRFSFRTLDPVTLKGKPDAVRLHLVETGPPAASEPPGHVAPFTGREDELRRLLEAFEEVRARSSMLAVTILGEAGLGKTRLVSEATTSLADRGVRVLEGRCLPYGEGVGFWALGEVVKAHAGILDSDPESIALEQLEQALGAAGDRAWLVQRLSPLVGTGLEGSSDRGESFAAWRRYLELVAQERPSVVVFEDLHWADDAFLAFLHELHEHPVAAPLLVIGTARPDLADRDPELLSGAGHVRLDLRPLTRDQIATLFARGVAEGVLGGSLDPIVDRVGGNPLFANEFARLLRERAVTEPAAGVPLPSSVHAVIAARIDALEPERKAVVTDASVVGGTFWSGAVAAVSGRTREDLRLSLRELASRGLIEPAARSSFEGDEEYTFSHILVRDVAYGQIPRAVRAAKHAATVAWIEERTGDRVDDFAEVLADHALTAIDLARAAAQHELVRSVGPKAVRFLTVAGERALGLDTQAAMTHLERAMVLVDPDDPQRPRVLLAFARAARDAGSLAESIKAAEESAELARSHGDLVTASAAYSVAATVRWANDHAEGERLAGEAVEVLGDLPPSMAHAEGFARLAQFLTHTDDSACVEVADRAIVIAEALGEDPPAAALMARGNSRCSLGERGGVEDGLRAAEVALARGDGNDAAHALNSAANDVLVFEGPREAIDVLDRGLELSRARGLRHPETLLRLTRLEVWFELGECGRLVEEARELAPEAEDDLWQLIGVLTQLMRGLVEMGRAGEAADDLAWLETEARESGTSEDVGAFAAVACARAQLGQHSEAAALLREADDLPGGAYVRAIVQGSMVRTALDIGEPELAERLVERFVARNTYGEHARVTSVAALSEARGQTAEALAGYTDAVARWDAFGVVPERAWASLGLGRCLLASSGEAEPALSTARALFDSMEAAPAVKHCEELMRSVVE